MAGSYDKKCYMKGLRERSNVGKRFKERCLVEEV